MGLTENGVPADNDDSILTDCNSIQSYNVPSNSGPALLCIDCLPSS